MTWYLEDAKQDVMVYADVRGIDLSLKRVIRQDYMPLIRENKVKPAATVRRSFQEVSILAGGLAALFLLVPEF